MTTRSEKLACLGEKHAIENKKDDTIIMSFETITTKLLDSVKREITKEEHIDTINNDIINSVGNLNLRNQDQLIGYNGTRDNPS